MTKLTNRKPESRKTFRCFLSWVCIIAITFSLCTTVFAAGGSVEQLPTITYVLNGEEYTAHVSADDLIGNYSQPQVCDGNIYLLSLPKGALVTQIDSSAYDNEKIYGTHSYGCDLDASSDRYIVNYYLSNGDFSSTENQKTGYYKYILKYGSFAKAVPTENVEGFAIKCTSGERTDDNLMDAIIVQISTASDEPPVPTITYGDLNGDEEITTDDAAMLYGVLRGTLTLTEEQAAAADVNGDGELTTDDAALVYGYLRGQVSSLTPAGN